MSGRGNCYDNAAVETFFKTIKAELIWRRTWQTRRQAEIAIFEYVNDQYNERLPLIETNTSSRCHWQKVGNKMFQGAFYLTAITP